MTVNLAIESERFSPDSGDGERIILEFHDAQRVGRGGGIGGGTAFDGDAPGSFAMLASDRGDRAGAAMEQGGGDFVLAQDRGGFIKRPTFANGTAIQGHALVSELNGEIGWIEEDFIHADEFASPLDDEGRRHLAIPFHEPPNSHERANGKVEGAIGLLPEFPSAEEQGEDTSTDADRFESSAGIDLGDFARRMIDVEAGFPALDFVEGFLGDGAELREAGPLKNDFEASGHRFARGF